MSTFMFATGIENSYPTIEWNGVKIRQDELAKTKHYERWRDDFRILKELGIKLVEQPVPAWNIGAMARLRARPDTPPLLADENVFDAHDMLAVAACPVHLVGAVDARHHVRRAGDTGVVRHLRTQLQAVRHVEGP